MRLILVTFTLYGKSCMKYFKLIPFLLIASVIPAIISCCPTPRQRTAALLDDVESYINARPDSARVVLENIGSPYLKTPALRARYSLLYAMALDKCYVNVASDSIIAYAARYYRYHGSADDKLKALYYQGVTYHYRKEFGKAAVLFSQAEELVEIAEDTHAKGVLYLTLADLYSKVYNIDKQQEYVEKAIDILSGTEDPMYERAFGQLGVPYMMRREWAVADSLFRRAMDASQNHPPMMRYIIDIYGRMKMFMDEPDPEGAIALFNQKVEKYGGSLSPAEAGAYAYASVCLGDEATAAALIERFARFNENDWNAVLPWMFRISVWRGDYQSAYEYLREAVEKQENTVHRLITNSVTQALLDNEESILEQERATKRTLSLLSLILILLLAVVALLMVLRKRAIQSEMNSLWDIHESLKREYEDSKFVHSGQIQLSEDNLKNQLDYLQNQLQKERIEHFRKKSALDYVVWMNETQAWGVSYALKEFKKEMMSFYKIEHNQRELARAMDDTLDGLVTELKNDLGIHNPRDVHFLCLWLLDTKAIVVSEILGMNNNTVYIRRSRLKEKIKSFGDKYSFLLK